MTPLRDFEEFLKEGVVKKQRSDASRAKSLAEEAENRNLFLRKMSDKIGVSDSNANYFIENAYDIMMELIRAKMLLKGFKSSGIAAHEAEVSYLKKLGFSESEVRFANDLRYFRNGINYYGKKFGAEYAKKVIGFLQLMYPQLKKLLKE